jgi:hypothetical protein
MLSHRVPRCVCGHPFVMQAHTFGPIKLSNEQAVSMQASLPPHLRTHICSGVQGQACVRQSSSRPLAPSRPSRSSSLQVCITVCRLGQHSVLCSHGPVCVMPGGLQGIKVCVPSVLAHTHR